MLSRCTLCVQDVYCQNSVMSCKEVIWEVFSLNCSTCRKCMVENITATLPLSYFRQTSLSSVASGGSLQGPQEERESSEGHSLGKDSGDGPGSSLSPVVSPALIREVQVTSDVLCRAAWEVLRSDGNELLRKAYKYIKFMNIYCTLHSEICQH